MIFVNREKKIDERNATFSSATSRSFRPLNRSETGLIVPHVYQDPFLLSSTPSLRSQSVILSSSLPSPFKSKEKMREDGEKIEEKREKVPFPLRTVWTASEDGTVKVWDTHEYNDYRHIRTLTHSDSNTHPFYCLLLYQSHIWAASFQWIYIWDLNGILIERIAVESIEIPTSIVSAGNYIWISYGRTIIVYSSAAPLLKGKLLKAHRILQDHMSSIGCMLYFNGMVWSCDSSGDIVLWSSELFEPIMPTVKKAHNGAIKTITCVKLGRGEKSTEIWTSGSDRMVRMWDSSNYICIKSVSVPEEITSTAFVKRSGNETNHCIWIGSQHSIGIFREDPNTLTNRRLVTYANGDKYVGEIYVTSEVLARHGRGEFHAKNGDIYVGYWRNDRRNGYGIMTYSNKDKYYGEWHDDQRGGRGVCVYSDGTCFEGQWKRDKKKGLGVLLFPNGDKIVGEWNGDEISKANYTKGSEGNQGNEKNKTPTLIEKLFWHRFGVTEELEDNEPVILPMSKWHNFSPYTIEHVRRQMKEIFPTLSINQKDLSSVLMNEKSCLGSMIAQYCYFFGASYHFTYGNAATLLYNAVDDVHSFLRRISRMIAEVFTNQKENKCWQLISDIVFTQIHDPLFALYKVMNQSKDTLLDVKMKCLSEVTLEALGTKKELIIKKKENQMEAEMAKFGSYEVNPSLELERMPYATTIRKLRQLTESRTVSNKLYILKEASRTILQSISDECVSNYEDSQMEEGEDESSEPMAVGAEDKLPILLYCLIQARVPNLHSELCWMKEFARPEVFTSEAQYRLIELEQATTYLEFLEWSVVESDGVLVSLSSLEKTLVYALAKEVNRMNQRGEPPKLIWISEILLICGSRRKSCTNLEVNNATSDEDLNCPINSDENEAPFGLTSLKQALKDYSNSQKETIVIGKKLDENSFQLDREYNTYTRDDYYFELAKSILKPIGIRLERDLDPGGLTTVIFEKMYPQYIYTKLARVAGQEIVRIENKTR